MDNVSHPPASSRGSVATAALSRRTVVRGAAWTAPTVALVVGVPAAAHASPGDTVVLWANTFDGIESGLPAGFTVRTASTTNALGTTAAFATTETTWADTGGNFRNVASADGLTSTSNQAAQNASTDRAVAVRQSGTFGDPGAAFVIDIGATSNVTGITIAFKAQSLDAGSARITTWTVDAFVGGMRIESGTTFTTGGSSFTNVTRAATFPSTLDNQPGSVFIRIVALSASGGSGSRATTAIDDVSVTGTSTV